MIDAETNARAEARLQSAMRLSLVVGVALMLAKVAAFAVTDSSAILSDAAESVVHVIAVAFAAFSLRLSHQPADKNHLYGHAKIGFVSAGFEGAAIVFAAGYILFECVSALIHGPTVQRVDLGLYLTAAVVVINGGLGFYLLGLGRRHGSLILKANGHHVLTDSITSLAVLVALGLVAFTGWGYWDPICGIAAAGHILVSGGRLVGKGWRGLMDEADPSIFQRVEKVLEVEVEARGITYHALRYRDLGNMLWVDFHLMFDGQLTVDEAHRIATEIEVAVDRAFQRPVYVTSHLEPRESHDDAHREAGKRRIVP
jgi:cation diffusion facilitator family transporter